MVIPGFPTEEESALPGVLQDVETSTVNIDSMEDITGDLIQTLRTRIARPLAIPGFALTLSKYLEWEKKQPPESLYGFDYDSRQQRLVLRPIIAHPAAEAFSTIVHWMRTLVKGLGDENPNGWSVQHSKPYALTGPYEGDVKRPQAVLISARNTRPSVVVHVSAKETQMELLDNVKQWLYGSNGRVKLVILIATEEVGAPDEKEEPWLNGLDLGVWESCDQLAAQIFEIEKSEIRPSIMGEILTSVWFLSQDNCSDAIPLCAHYTFKCGLSRHSPQKVSMAPDFTGAPFVDSALSMHLHGISLQFPFAIFGNAVQRGVLKFLHERAKEVADKLWMDYEYQITQENIIKAGFGYDDIKEEPYPLPYC